VDVNGVVEWVEDFRRRGAEFALGFVHEFGFVHARAELGPIYI
jgi:hypothetical protein